MGGAHPAKRHKDPPLKSASATTFDEAYYQRFYFDKKTSVVDPAHMERLGTFVCSYLKYLRVPVSRVLDVGCGIGLWKGIVAQHFPEASYQGVEFSPYLCERFGWQQGSVVDYVADKPFDLVICQGVLPYLSPPDLKAALLNLGRLTQGALYVEAVSREDFERDIIDEEITDNRVFRHRAELYRRGLREGAIELGGGVWLSRRAGVPPGPQPLHLRTAPRAAHARGHVPADGRPRTAQAQQHRLADCRCGGRHLRVWLGAHRGAPRPAGAAGRPPVAAVCGVSG